MSKIAVLTSLFGLDNAKISNPTIVFKNADYFALTDGDRAGSVWNLIPELKFSVVDTVYKDRRNAKVLKILAPFILHNYDYFFWHDAHCELAVDPSYIIDNFLSSHDIAVFEHPQRACVYEEAKVLLTVNKETKINIINTVNFLKEANYPKNNGLFELTSFAYKNTNKIKVAFLMWWELICKYSSRDQLTFPFIALQNNLDISTLPGAALAYGGNNNYFPQTKALYS